MVISAQQKVTESARSSIINGAQAGQTELSDRSESRSIAFASLLAISVRRQDVLPLDECSTISMEYIMLPSAHSLLRKYSMTASSRSAVCFLRIVFIIITRAKYL